jgi:hypothetical protein
MISIWRKSSYSNSRDDCVEVALGAQVGVRDSKNPAAGALIVSPAAWSALLDEAEIR